MLNSKFLLVCVFLVSSQALAALQIQKGSSRVPQEILTRFRGTGSTSRVQALAVAALRKVLGDSGVLSLRALKTDTRLAVIRIADDSKIVTALSVLSAQTDVEFAEPNQRFYALDDGTPDDPDLLKTWGIRNTGQPDSTGVAGVPGADVNVFPLWQQGLRGSRKTLVAVIDTGIDWTHPDIAANLYTNPAEAGANEGNGKDNDGNGFINDIHGWNFAAHTNDSRDDHNHGTHCSGTIGAVGNNGIGVVGVN